MVLSYDEKYDILYLSFFDRSRSYGDEEDGIVIMRDMETDEITGITIYDFKQNSRSP